MITTISPMNKIFDNFVETVKARRALLPDDIRQQLENGNSQEEMLIDLNEKYNIPLRYHGATFENFKTETEEQKNVLETIKNHAWNKNIYLNGKVGTGKTHLAMCLKRQGAKYYRLSDFFREIRLDFNCEQELINKLGNVKLLIFDEIGRQKFSDFEKNLFFEIIDKRWLAIKPTLLISNLTFKEFAEEYGNAILDRLRPILLMLSGESKRGENINAR